jgi:hypothetical protein
MPDQDVLDLIQLTRQGILPSSVWLVGASAHLNLEALAQPHELRAAEALPLGADTVVAPLKCVRSGCAAEKVPTFPDPVRLRRRIVHRLRTDAASA